MRLIWVAELSQTPTTMFSPSQIVIRLKGAKQSVLSLEAVLIRHTYIGIETAQCGITPVIQPLSVQLVVKQ